MHPFHHAASQPDKPAVIMANSGARLSYAELEARSNQAAQLFRACGLRRGDVIAMFLLNGIDFLPLCWGAQRAGLVYTCISTRLTADEAGYIVSDSGAKLLIASAALGEVAKDLPALENRFASGGTIPGFASLEDSRDAQ
ncbi:MAG: AMP-binding protein, partial [Thermaurantiacus sp.]